MKYHTRGSELRQKGRVLGSVVWLLRIFLLLAGLKRWIDGLKVNENFDYYAIPTFLKINLL